MVTMESNAKNCGSMSTKMEKIGQGRFSFECPKTKTKVITMAKLKEGKHHKERMRIQSKMNCSKRGKTRATKLRFLFGPAFDWLKEWASFCLNSKLW